MDASHGADLQAIQALVEPILAEREMELVELTGRSQGRQQLLRLLVDKVGGVTIQECAKANRLIGEALEAADLIAGSYLVEVSSPGLDRPLVSKRDFERTLGENLQVEFDDGEGRAKTLQGMLLAVQHEAIVLKTPSGNITIPFGDIRGAKKAIRW
ncbi:MAG: ribosome maturation factor RimP [Candidatus Omnitrophica bacterium]|nr:ribosome maturation factor RimP [Candidatus Omnitrophota bacterium]